jgi:hypothetical protein
VNDKKHAYRPWADSLEARVALSAGTTQAEITILSAVTKQAAIAGTLPGRYIATAQDNRAADEPLRVQVTAGGKLQGLGKVSLSGSLDFGGFLPANQPDITGTVTLTNAKGSVTVRLTGSGGNGQIPNHRFALNASIVSGTGDYANLRGIGTAVALFGKNTVRSITTPSPIGGVLTLQLNLRPPVR